MLRAAVPLVLPALMAIPLLLSACATTRIYSAAELSAVGRGCGVAEGEVVQETDEPRILFLYTLGPSREQISCVQNWSRKHKLHLALIEGANWTSQ